MAGVTKELLATYATSDGVALGELVRKREVSPLELVEAAVATIERLNPRLNAVVHRLYDMGRAGAAAVDTSAPFAGVPYLLKELGTSWQGAPLTNSSRYLKDVVAQADSEVVKRIKAAGFLLVGKSNAPENGWSISTEPKLYGPTFNPWREDVTAGGSSGGAAASVASRMVPIAEASDAAGSIRVPASCCGVVGLKPSRGRITASPRADLWHGSANFLCNSRTVRDTAAYLDAVAGFLPGDPYTPPKPDQTWARLARQAPARLRVGFTLTPPDGGPVDPEVAAAVRHTAAILEGLGHEVEERNMALDGRHAWQTYTHMSCAQAAAFFEAMETVVGRPVTAADVEPVTWAIIERGRATRGVRHFTDVEAVRQIGRAIATDLLPFDVFLTPTLTQKPRPLGYYDMAETDLDRYNALWSDAIFAFPFNMSGLPAISLPLHWSADGLPIGMQFVGRYGDEATLLALGTVLEGETPWRDKKPPASA
jgi:amidase